MIATNFLSRIWDGALDLLFPRKCFGCGQEDFWLCPECFTKIIKVQEQLCPKCHRVSALGQFCPSCKKDKKLSGVLVSLYLDQGSVRDLIHALKYDFIFGLAPILASFMIEPAFKLINEKKIDYIVPVPLHKSRFSWRGFNHAEKLAEIISFQTKVALKTRVLVRRIKTTPQVELKREERLKNVRGAFCCPKPEEIFEKSIILVDDVLTTGATLEECAKTLRQAGAKNVWGLVIARGN